MFAGQWVRAEEGGEAPAAEGEAAAGEAAEGEAAKPSPGAGADREWAKRQSKLNVHEAQIKDLTKKVQGLIRLKNTGGAAVDDKGNPIDLLASIAENHKKLKETIAEYSVEKAEMKYRFPEEGVLIERRYVPMREQSLEQIELEMGLDGDLIATKKKIDKKYGSFMGDDLAKPAPQMPKAPESTIKRTRVTGDEPKRLKLSQ